jgi:hypothetical protein
MVLLLWESRSSPGIPRMFKSPHPKLKAQKTPPIRRGFCVAPSSARTCASARSKNYKSNRLRTSAQTSPATACMLREASTTTHLPGSYADLKHFMYVQAISFRAVQRKMDIRHPLESTYIGVAELVFPLRYPCSSTAVAQITRVAGPAAEGAAQFGPLSSLLVEAPSRAASVNSS